MPGLLIKNVPAPTHRKLKESATRHRRSLMQEALVLLEDALTGADAAEKLPPPYRGSFPLTKSLIDRAKRAGRE
jgi:plasmid stability protein